MEVLRHRRVFATARPLYARDWQRSGGFPAHGHDFHEIVLITRGTGAHIRRGGEDDLRPGDLLTLRPGDWHAYRHAGELAGIDCAFDPLLLQRELAWTADDARLARLLWHQTGGEGARRLRPASDTGALQHFRALVGLEGGGPDARGEQIGRLLCLLSLAARLEPAEDAAARIHPAAAEAARLMDEAPALPWTVAGLARRLGCRPDHLSRVFARDLGAPPQRWLLRRRVRTAQGLLLRSELPVAEIAAQVGWDDANLFARRFRAETGMSASDWRKRFATPAAKTS